MCSLPATMVRPVAKFTCRQLTLQCTGSKTPISICDLPETLLSPDFTGRDEDLKQLTNILNTATNERSPHCVICGMQGVGKTQLVVKFGMNAFAEKRFDYIFWISATSEEKLLRDYTQLANLLHLPERMSPNEAEKVSAVRSWLQAGKSSSRWLMIMDNANLDTIAKMRDILPRNAGHGRVVVTAHQSTVAEALPGADTSRRIALKTLHSSDAEVLLLKGAHKERALDAKGNDALSVQRLVQKIGFLPLAIEQAASFMRENGNSAWEVFQMYENDTVDEVSAVEDSFRVTNN